MFFVFSLNIGKTSALVKVCVIICAADMLLIEESWFILILPWCVLTEVAWITDEVWITDKPFLYP